MNTGNWQLRWRSAVIDGEVVALDDAGRCDLRQIRLLMV
jgi:ATP-dependent DNA ligase